jgi:hypothetical protein
LTDIRIEKTISLLKSIFASLIPTLVMLCGCMTQQSVGVSDASNGPGAPIAGTYVWIHTSGEKGNASGGVYLLTLTADGSYRTGNVWIMNGLRVMDSTLHAGGYDMNEQSSGKWHMEERRLILLSDGLNRPVKTGSQPVPEEAEAKPTYTQGRWTITWGQYQYKYSTDVELKVLWTQLLRTAR